MSIQTIQQYIDKHHRNKNFSYPAVALQIIFDPHVDIRLRASMVLSLEKHFEETRIAQALLPSKIRIFEIVHEIEAEWMNEMRHDRNAVGQDLAEWMVGRKVGEVSGGFIHGTYIPIAYLDKMIFTTHALRFALSVNGGTDVCVKVAERLNPKSAAKFA